MLDGREHGVSLDLAGLPAIAARPHRITTLHPAVDHPFHINGLGECGMCGCQGRGVWDDAVSTVAEYCCHCTARTRQTLDGTCQVCGKHAESGDEARPGEISFTSDGQHVCVEFDVSRGSAGVTVFAAPADADAAPGMGVLHFAPPPEHARAIGRALLALADAAERGKDAR